VKDLGYIEALIKLLKENDIAEIAVTKGRDSVRVVRQGQVAHLLASAPSGGAPAAIAAAPVSAQAQSLGVQEAAQPALPEGHLIRSPMVGVFYASPSPDQEAFVSVGQKVAVGASLCLIEAMKMFNKITADKAGKITHCLVKNGDPIEFDQPLFVLDDSA
jgi:acetyl-CoA carboxylase biotin carboxyl carrier protein